MTDPSVVRGFSSMIMDRLSLPIPQTTPPKPLVCLIKQALSRQVLNEEELVAAVGRLVQIRVVQFEGLSFREQVRMHCHQEAYLFNITH